MRTAAFALLAAAAPSSALLDTLSPARRRSSAVHRCRFAYGGYFWDLAELAKVQMQSEPMGGAVYFGTQRRNAHVMFQVCRNLRTRSCSKSAPVLIRLNEAAHSATTCKRGGRINQQEITPMVLRRRPRRLRWPLRAWVREAVGRRLGVR